MTHKGEGEHDESGDMVSKIEQESNEELSGYVIFNLLVFSLIVVFLAVLLVAILISAIR